MKDVSLDKKITLTFGSYPRLNHEYPNIEKLTLRTVHYLALTINTAFPPCLAACWSSAI